MNQYVFFATCSDHMVSAYSDLFDVDNVRYQKDYLYHPTKLLSFLEHVHCRSRIGLKLHLPLKRIWYPLYFSEKYVEGNQYVFVFFFNWHLVFQNGYIDYLRRHYPGCKCVLFLQDVDNAKKLEIQAIKRIFDHIMVFEKNFAQEQDIAYYPLVYSSQRIGHLLSERPIDLLFVGQEKGRYALLRGIYDRLSSQGINCQFYISNTDKKNESLQGIHFVDFLPYNENISLLRRSKCVLDIVPPKTNCNTLRMYEAIAYDVRMLTNNSYVSTEDYFDPALISLYTTPETIDIDFLKKPYTPADYGYKDKISPLELLRYLDRVLNL